MDGIQLRDEAVRDRIRAATEFLDPTDPRARSYRADIVLMLNRGLRRLVVSIDEIRAHNRELADGLLYHPFDYSLCFDEALKRVIATLPNRTLKETSDDTVRSPLCYRYLRVLTRLGILLRIFRQLWRKRLQSTNSRFQPPESNGLVGGHRYQVLSCPTESREECALEREKGNLCLSRISRSDYDCQWCRKLERIPTRG